VVGMGRCNHVEQLMQYNKKNCEWNFYIKLKIAKSGRPNWQQMSATGELGSCGALGSVLAIGVEINARLGIYRDRRLDL
jgi:hypothetical protein